ncbi:MAG: TetR/AcrR family transcriptional regulator C-terminal domain-containing protein [Burkholderiales bacterium]|nr:TetR/AcrR family transcriptional regulator C-terminal domain-containing protein [Anaerolineae bacterium]
MQNVELIEDLRVRRTRKMIQEAFMALTVEKGFSALTVRDITERAMINRSTFYRHFLDKYDLLEKYMDDVEAIIASEPLTEEMLEEHKNSGSNGLIKLLKHIQENAEFYRVMLGQQGDAAFTCRFQQNSAERFRELMAFRGVTSDTNGLPNEMRVNYVACAGMGAIMWWLDNGQPCSAEQLAMWLGQLTMPSLGMLPFPQLAAEN